ncbi:hypothetical protein CBS147339_122 [Penicillium roqueforti]|uniref:Uncharacterized protein n=1 Tax=Penicillium roqueforti (strain FM164) TaxID=1365484 RepID=W6Q4A5_PENRF|nr:hypothetical protein CBS147339_122 [Penicillium roqueforti]CDM31175.1 hypothetical protein PROQFM164_S02g001325 [Penicillium roqueforti FM164]KAI3096364.1 hypothetical protein CBS147338_5347 [Penicillium roqueforti]KAI3156958.1 hypothetical protein CBS147325_658 [Penicillium roqueforti]KAI3183126.1 hypothetical protein DTO046C5_141 [Penicillium roqueforti]
MSLRPLGYQCKLPYAQLFRNGLQTKQNITQHLRSFSQLRDTHCARRWSATFPHHANKAFSLRSLLGDLLRPAHTIRGQGKGLWAQQSRYESSAAKEPELCAHCGGKTIPKARKHVEPGNPSSGWYCKPCVRNIRAHGHLPNEEQLAGIHRRRLIRASGEASKTSPCGHCGQMTAPRSSRKFIDANNPSAGFHCRTCVRHVNHHGTLPTDLDLAAFQYRKQMRSRRPPTVASKNNKSVTSTGESAVARKPSKSPKQMKQSRGEYPCMHCGDKTISSSKRRLVEPQNPAAGYYCQPCTRSLLETDALPSTVKIAALRKLRATRMQSNPRVMKSPCVHCGEITAPSSKRRLVEAKNAQSGYYCRACADCLIETNSLPSDIRLAVRRAREQVRLKNLQASLSKESQSPVSPQDGEATPTDILTDNTAKTCAHCRTEENTSDH